MPTFLLHAPDGFFSTPIAVIFWVITAALLAYSLSRASKELDERAVPLMGVLAAFIFAGQMFNFSIPGGTSGHLLGGVLAAILLGPWAGTIVMACVVGVQGVVFQDGGLLVMGVNIFNMGIVGTLGGYALYRALMTVIPGGKDARRSVAAAISAWTAVEVAAIIAAFQLAASDTTSLGAALVAMAGWHALIGIGEAAVTVAALSFIAASRPDLLHLHAPVSEPVVAARTSRATS